MARSLTAVLKVFGLGAVHRFFYVIFDPLLCGAGEPQSTKATPNRRGKKRGFLGIQRILKP